MLKNLDCILRDPVAARTFCTGLDDIMCKF
jgi:hypothetical protein